MKIFVLLSRFPYPLEKGDKLRAFHQIKELSKNHEIVLCALSDEKVDSESIQIMQRYCSRVEIIKLNKIKIAFELFYKLFFTKDSLQVSYFYNKLAQQRIDLLIKEIKPNHIYCQLIRVTEYVKNQPIKKTLDYMDALARGMERRIENTSFYLKPFLKIEATRLKRYEHQIFDCFDNKIIISNQDKDLIVHLKNDEIVVIPNGVDYDAYQFREIEKKYDLIFTGNMSYPPNVESVIFLVKEIMPLVWNKYPNLKLAIVGANPDIRVKMLQTTNVIVTGRVKDIAEYYAQSKIFIAPMLIGTGLQNKLLEAMAMKLPSITSQLANNALGATHEKEILIGKNPKEYAINVFRLLENESDYKSISENGYTFVKQHYTWEGRTEQLNQLILKS